MEEKPGRNPVDEIVDKLLRDQDFLLAQEIKSKVEELNQNFVQAQRLKLKVDISTSQFEVQSGKVVTWLDVKIYKEI